LKEKAINNADLIRSLSRGNEEAFRSIYVLYYKGLCLYANRILKNNDECEDVVQSIIMKLWENKENIEDITDIKSYLYRSTYNGCLNKLSKLDNKQKYQNESWLKLKEIEMEDRDSLQYTELNEIVNRLIDELPEQCQRVYKMNRSDEKSYIEISQELNITVKAVEANISRALQKLRLGLKDFLVLIVVLYFK
jgi:RNA polymerase sigma-70 factor (ECF subfamily)